MKQIIIRIIPGVNTVYDVVFGHIIDGQFNPSPIDNTEFPIPSLVRCDDLLGGTSFVKADDLTHLIAYYQHRSRNIAFYPNMLVFTLKDFNHESEEED